MKLLAYIFVFFGLFSCSGDKEEALDKNYILKPDGSKVYRSEGVELTLLEKGEQGNVINFEGVSFVFKDISSLNYLKRIGKYPSREDELQLAKESVHMLELVGHKPSGSIFENSGIKRNQADAIKYLVGDIEKDFVIVQNEKRIKPLGVQYDGVIGTGQKIRVAFFMEGIDLSHPYTIEYYDRLFGKGLIKLSKNKTDLTS